MRINIRQLFFLILFIGLFSMTIRPIADPDFWWHLRTGQLIAETHAIPHADPFSFTNAGKAWTAHEWLSELTFYGIYVRAGYAGLIFLFSLIITGAFLLTYFRCSPDTRPYIAGFSLLLGAISTAPTWGVRPQMISLLFTSFFLYLLDRYKETGHLKFIAPIPLIILLWVNLHAGYFLGLAVAGIYLIGMVLEMIGKKWLAIPLKGIVTFKSTIWLYAVLMISLFAACVNPNGWHILIYPFQTLTSPSMMQLIQEWFSPDFHQLSWQPLAGLILLLVGLGMVSKKTFSLTQILVVLALGYLALRSMRNVPLFAIAAVPILAEEAASLIRIRTETGSPSRLFKWLAPILAGIMVLFVGLRFFQVIQQQQETEKKTFPAAAVDWIEVNHPELQLFNTYGWGGYLIWRLYPTYKVYIDGRADVYGDKFIFDYMGIQNAQTGWETKLANANVETILIEPETPLASVLRTSPNWGIAFQDRYSVLYIKK